MEIKEETSDKIKDDFGISEMESLCMNCMEMGMTRIMIHKIPYFRELIISSFECPNCGEKNNEVTFGGEIQIQVLMCSFVLFTSFFFLFTSFFLFFVLCSFF